MEPVSAIIAFLLSAIIECTASGSAIPAYQISLCQPFGILTATAGGGAGLLKWIGIAVGIIVLIFVIKNVVKGEGEFQKNKNTLLKRLGAHFWNKGMKFLNENRVLQTIKPFRIGYVTPEGVMAYTFKTNRALFYTLINWCKRLEIYFGKRDTVTNNSESGPDKDLGKPGYYNKYALPKIQKHRDFRVLQEEIDDFKLGNVAKDRKGRFQYDKEVIQHANKVLEVLDKMQRYDTMATAEQTAAKTFIQDAIKEFTDIHLSTVTQAKGYIVTSMNEYDTRFDAYGGHMLIKSINLELTDQYNASEHTFRFANEDEEYVDASTGNRIGTVQEYLNAHRHLKRVEINKYGRFFDDPSLKLKNPSKFYWEANINDLCTWMGFDWRALIDEMRYGIYHQKSRSVNEYIQAHAKGIHDDKKVMKTGLVVDRQNPAFDKRAFDNPGKLTLPGRPRYDDPKDVLKTDEEKDPALSTLGMAIYADDLVTFQIKDSEKAKQFMDLFPADSSSEERRNVITKLSRIAEKSK